MVAPIAFTLLGVGLRQVEARFRSALQGTLGTVEALEIRAGNQTHVGALFLLKAADFCPGRGLSGLERGASGAQRLSGWHLTQPLLVSGGDWISMFPP